MEPELGKVSPPSAADLKKLPAEFAGKWPAWNIGGFIRYGFKLLRRRDEAIKALLEENAALTARVAKVEAAVGAGSHPHTATVTSKVELK